MMTSKIAFALILVFTVAQQSAATSALVYSEFSTPSPAAIADGAPASGLTVDLFVTTDADILAIDQLMIRLDVCGGGLFHVDPPFGSDSSPPEPAFLPLRPALQADSWVTTPGSTFILGDDPFTNGSTAWGDVTNDGPQDRFHFARLTFLTSPAPPIEGRIALQGSAGPEFHDFGGGGLCPEPSSVGLCLLAVGGLLFVRTR